MGDLVFPAVSFRAIVPVALLAATGCLVLLLDLVVPPARRGALGALAVGGVLAMLVAALGLWGLEERAFGGMALLDGFGLFFTLVIGFGVALVLLLSLDYVRRLGVESGEFYALVLFATVGMVLMATTGSLTVIFLGLETMTISLYVLAGFFRTRVESGEASLKYFLLGAFASGIFLYGIALIFGATGSTNLDRIGAAVAGGAGREPMFLIGLGLLLVGFAFKISSVPFHMWAADVYQGAPTSVTALIATGSKAAAFAALLRVLLAVLRPPQAEWALLLWGLAALSMVVGNVVAVAQSNLKRLLAYSSIAHVGYMLVGLVAGGTLGAASVLYYLFVYTFTTAGAFGVITLLEREQGQAVEIGDVAGLGRRHPLAALAFTLFLLSLVGMPPLAGFVGKIYLFWAAVQAGYIWLVVVAVLTSAIAAYYYLRVIVYMYMREPERAPATLVPSLSGACALVVALWGIVQYGVLPAPLMDLARTAVAPLLR